jgi:hypothetical protein
MYEKTYNEIVQPGSGKRVGKKSKIMNCGKTEGYETFSSIRPYKMKNMLKAKENIHVVVQ